MFRVDFPTSISWSRKIPIQECPVARLKVDSRCSKSTPKINHHSGQQVTGQNFQTCKPNLPPLWIHNCFRCLLCDKKLARIPWNLANANRAEVPAMRKSPAYPESLENPTDEPWSCYSGSGMRLCRELPRPAWLGSGNPTEVVRG